MAMSDSYITSSTEADWHINVTHITRYERLEEILQHWLTLFDHWEEGILKTLLLSWWSEAAAAGGVNTRLKYQIMLGFSVVNLLRDYFHTFRVKKLIYLLFINPIVAVIKMWPPKSDVSVGSSLLAYSLFNVKSILLFGVNKHNWSTSSLNRCIATGSFDNPVIRVFIQWMLL